VLSGLAGLAQINPIWLYGPYDPTKAAAATSGSQPDWYVGWLDGALRLMPGWEIRAFDHTIANPFFPGALLPGVTFALMYAWPMLERRFTKDTAPHNLLNRPRDAPVRTGIGAAALMFYGVLFLAGGNDVLASLLQIAPETITNIFRVLLVAGPVGVFLVTRGICRGLARSGAHPTEGPVGSRLVRTPAGGYEEVEDAEELVSAHALDDASDA
jgi:ubiquinol-cytochrome c reductase cytochrome b subunit